VARKLVWSADARRNLRNLFMFVAVRNRDAAHRLEQLIVDGAERVAALPLAYRPGRARETPFYTQIIFLFIRWMIVVSESCVSFTRANATHNATAAPHREAAA